MNQVKCNSQFVMDHFITRLDSSIQYNTRSNQSVELFSDCQDRLGVGYKM